LISLESVVPRSRLSFLILTVLAIGTAQARPLRTERLEVVTASGPHRFAVEVADTFATRERGLMFRKRLAPDRGMLFKFSGPPQRVSFWMKNTLIPLDMLFIADSRIVSIAENAVPLSETTIPSGAPVTEVVELPGGRAAEIGAAPGDAVRELRGP
jgi:hypothetical protein